MDGVSNKTCAMLPWFPEVSRFRRAGAPSPPAPRRPWFRPQLFESEKPRGTQGNADLKKEFKCKPVRFQRSDFSCQNFMKYKISTANFAIYAQGSNFHWLSDMCVPYPTLLYVVFARESFISTLFSPSLHFEENVFPSQKSASRNPIEHLFQ